MAGMDQSKIRNFCIIAHIDHGKSTLADRIIEMTGLLTSREMQSQVLDNMDLERERGITIKSQAVRTVYRAKDGEEYIFNLIDTPGHVDFNYEVSRSLAACDGAILVVDAAQGIEAQTLANVYLALDHDLDVVPVINKIDLPSARPDWVADEIEDVIGIEAHDAPRISAKTGLNVEEVLEAIVHKIPAPGGDAKEPLKALIFDSLYDPYKGVIVFCRVKEGTVQKGTRIRMMATGAEEDVVEVGYFGAGQFIPCESLSAGMVGYITASIKNVKDTRVGDTITDAKRPCDSPLPGYKKVTSMVYCGLYPADGAKYNDLRDALEKLRLNDASLFFEPETSIALGFGFRCGFLGLLHLEIIQERLEREYNLDLVTTAPGVVYRVYKKNGDMIELTNPSNLPDPTEIDYMEEPIVSAEIMVTTEFVGAIMSLCQERRGVYNGMEYIEETRALLKYDLPLNEIIYDFFDNLKQEVSLHLVQSQYAYQYLLQRGISSKDILYVSDYIGENYGRFQLPETYRKNIALYNPRKGNSQAMQPLIDQTNWLKWIPLRNYTEEEMIALMEISKLYIDFGTHPGKDRIPREAASCGCCIVTNRKGSANFYEDIPIPDCYKINNNPIDYTQTAQLLLDICMHWGEHNRQFDYYRQSIASEREKFSKDVNKFVNTIETEHGTK